MPPKGPTKSEKLASIHTYLAATRTAHTLRELEKALPSIASVPSILVKDFIKDLVDDGKIKCEKIGSGNWYWCFPSDEQAALQRKAEEKSRLEDHVEKSETEIRDLNANIEEMKASKERNAGDQAYAALFAHATRLESEIQSLRAQKEDLRQAVDGGAGDIDTYTRELAVMRREAEIWTDNIYILESYIRDKLGVDRETFEALQREYYGDEFVEGEGLRELIFG